MAIEIERKFTVANDAWKTKVRAQSYYKQGYLSSDPACSVRVRIADDHAFLNIKSATLGVRRSEFEYPIPRPDAEEMLANLCRGPLIEKTRYFVEHAGKTWEIDVFEGDNKGLVVAEIELNDADEVFEIPSWAGEDVSHDPRYYNVSLVTRPYKDWQ